MSRQLRIAFGHKARSGKDTACDYIATKLRTQRIRFAEGVYDIAEYSQKRLGKPAVKDPGLLQLIGEGFRQHYGPTVWIEGALKNLDADADAIVVSDMRYRAEAEALKRAGFTLIRIDRPDRPIDRDPNHPSEVDLDGYPFDHYLVNDESKEMFLMRVSTLVDTLITP